MNNFKYIYNEKWKWDLQKVYKHEIMFPTTNIHNQKKIYIYTIDFLKQGGPSFPLKSTKTQKLKTNYLLFIYTQK